MNVTPRPTSSGAPRRTPRSARRGAPGGPRRDLRVTAVRVLQGLMDGGGSLTQRLPPALEALAPGDRARCQALCFGLARWHLQLEAIAARLMDKPLKPKDRDLAWLIELGLYQLLHTDAPPARVVDEAVQATVALNKGWARGLVNAVLRRALREREAEPTPDASRAAAVPESLVSGLPAAIRSAHPGWLHARLAADWPDALDALLVANNTQAPMTLRTGSGQREGYLERLREAGLGARALPEAKDAVQLDDAVPVDRLPGFEVGAASVQDVAAQLAVELLIEAVPSGGRLLDACAAPGGKTGHALQSGHFADVLALDVDATRLQRVRGTIDRLRGDATVGDVPVELRPGDAGDPLDWWDGRPFDAILLDAPCSGTGVIRRHPDIKLLRRERDLEALCAGQARLLDALWPLLAPGGVLLYATCSTLKAENEDQVRAFLERTPGARAEPLPERAGLDRGCGRQRLPGRAADREASDGDGFWYALLQPRSSTPSHASTADAVSDAVTGPA